MDPKPIRPHAFYRVLFDTGKFATDGSDIYLWQDKQLYWRCIRAPDIQRTVRRLVDPQLLPYISTATAEETLEMLKGDPRLYKDFEATRDENQNLIHFKNGVFNIKTAEFIEDEEFIRSRSFDYCMNLKLIEKPDITQAPTWNYLLQSSLQAVPDSSKAQLAYELLAYAVCRNTTAEKAVILYGDSGSGKSLMCNLIESAFSSHDVSAFALNNLGTKTWSIKFKNISVAICREIPMEALGSIDIFKSVISCEKITGEEKYAISESFVPHCKLVMAGNTLPNFREVDDTGNRSLIRRFVVLPFEKTHTDLDIDLGLKKKLIGERDIIFSYAMKYLPALVERNFMFTECDDSKRLLAQYEEEQDILPAFIEDCCDVGKHFRIHNAEILEAVKVYYSENGMTCQLSDNQILTRITRLCKGERDKFRLNGKNLRGIKGIRLKDDF